MRLLLLLSVSCLAPLVLTGCPEGGDDTISGSCVYVSATVATTACLNLWDGEVDCPDVQGIPGAWREGDSCEELGYPDPCTHDLPDSLWVEQETDCAQWEG